MSRVNHFRHWAAVSAFVFLAATFAIGGVLLDDNFTNPAESHAQWLNTSDDMTVTVNSGSCALENTSQYPGAYLHTLSAPKPSTFTISYTLKSQTGGATKSGALFCKQADAYTGYFLTVGENQLVLYNMTQTGDGISWTPIYSKNSFDINPSDNEITVSKIGSRIVFSANGKYVGELTDNTYSSGDLALFLSGGTTAVFGPVRVTNEFTDGEPRAYFLDNFDNGRSKYWNYVKNGGNPEISSANGTLTIKTGAGVYSWMYVDMEHTDFAARVDVRHLGGGTTINHVYGIVLTGDAPLGGGQIPMVYFGITGGRRYSVWSTADPERPDPVLSSNIKGSAGETAVVYIDTLEVSKKSGSSTYEFAVNGQALSTDYPVVDFTVTGIGIFNYPDIQIQFDNFEAEKEGATSIRFSRNTPRTLRGSKAVKSANNVFYDLRGRKRYTVNPGQRIPMRSAGMYINENGREVSVRKNRR